MGAKAWQSWLAGTFLAASSVILVACDDSSSAVKEPQPSPIERPGPGPGAESDGGAKGDGGAKDCFDDPKTHYEIINACTTATKIAKDPVLPKLLPDGGLPALD